MDLDAYWQENKRFVATVAAGVVVFFLGWMLIDRFLGEDLRAEKSDLARLESDLAKPMHGAADLAAAEEDNARLRETVAALRAAVEFEPRPQFRLEPGGNAASRYLGVGSNLREELTTRAGRAGLLFPSDLGLPQSSPVREVEIARHLEALDVIERAITLAIEAGMERIDRIRIKLDSRVASGKPVDDLEKTLVTLEMTGSGNAVARFVQLLRDPSQGRPSVIDSASLKSASRSAARPKDEVKLEIALAAAHLHSLGVPAGAGEGR